MYYRSVLVSISSQIYAKHLQRNWTCDAYISSISECQSQYLRRYWSWGSAKCRNFAGVLAACPIEPKIFFTDLHTTVAKIVKTYFHIYLWQRKCQKQCCKEHSVSHITYNIAYIIRYTLYSIYHTLSIIYYISYVIYYISYVIYYISYVIYYISYVIYYIYKSRETLTSLPVSEFISTATRCATVTAATRRGWVQAIMQPLWSLLWYMI